MSFTILEQFRVETGDQTTPYVFSNDEMNYFIEKAEGNFTKAKILLVDRLIADNHKLHKWQAADKSGDPGDVVKNLLLWREHLERTLKNEKEKNLGASVNIGGINEWI